MNEVIDGDRRSDVTRMPLRRVLCCLSRQRETGVGRASESERQPSHPLRRPAGAVRQPPRPHYLRDRAPVTSTTRARGQLEQTRRRRPADGGREGGVKARSSEDSSLPSPRGFADSDAHRSGPPLTRVVICALVLFMQIASPRSLAALRNCNSASSFLSLPSASRDEQEALRPTNYRPQRRR